MIKYLLYLTTLLFVTVSFSQTWQPIGPFYGKDASGNKLHTMGYVSAVYMNPNNPNEVFMGTNSSGIFKTTNRGEKWDCVTENTDLIPGMGIQSIAVNPKNSNVMLAAAGNFTYSCDTYYGQVLVSNDRGNSWSIIKSFKTGWKEEIIKIAYKSENEVYVATSSELFYSNDNLTSWKSIFKIDESKEFINSNAQQIVDFELLQENTILISSTQKWGAKGQVWRTFNNGENWEGLIKSNELKGLEGKQVMCTKLATPIGSNSIISVSIASDIYTYKSTDNGKTYTQIGSFKTDYETGDAKAIKFEVEFSKKDTSKLYFGFIEFFEWTKAAGLKMLSPTPNISENEHDDVRTMVVYLDPKTNEEYLLMGNDGGVSLYYPEQNKFESLNGESLNTVQVYNMGMSQYGDNFKILIGTQDNGTFQYQNNDWVWVEGGDGGASWLSKEGDKEFYCINATLVFKKGRIKRYYSPNKRNSSWFLDYPAEMKANESTIVFGSNKTGDAKGARVFIQDGMGEINNGVEIERVGGINAIKISDNNENLIYVSGSDWNDKNENNPRLLKSTNGGTSFIDLTKSKVYSSNYSDTTSLFDLLSYRLISDIEIDPLDDDIVYVSITGLPESDANKVRANMHVLKSYDGGLTWVDFTEGLPMVPAHKLIRHAGAKELIFCGTDAGMYYREKGDNSWKNFNGGFPKNQAVTDLKINYCQNKLYAATFGRGIWSVDIKNGYKKAVTKIGEDTQWDSSEKFQLTDLIIKKNTTLEINGNLLLAKNCQVILEPKSKLIINGGNITSKCSGDWDKIIIEEKRFLFFFKKKKGKIIILKKETKSENEL